MFAGVLLQVHVESRDYQPETCQNAMCLQACCADLTGPYLRLGNQAVQGRAPVATAFVDARVSSSLLAGCGLGATLYFDTGCYTSNDCVAC